MKAGKVFHGWLGVAYRWQIWWKMEEDLADDFLYAVEEGQENYAVAAATAGLLAAALAAGAEISAGLSMVPASIMGLIAAALTLKATLKAVNLDDLRDAQEHSGGKLVFFLDIWTVFACYKTKWLDDGSVHTLLRPEIRIGLAQAKASKLSTNWEMVGRASYNRLQNTWVY